MKSSNRAYFICSIIIALLLCAAQIRGSAFLILICLAMFIAMLCWGSVKDKALPLLLFFLPWSPVLRTSPNSFSFYTIGLVLMCLIGMIKNWTQFKRYPIVAGILLLFFTLLSKLIDGSHLTMAYICFAMMVFLFPLAAHESREQRYDFEEAVIYLSTGIVLASLCAQQFAAYPNIARYIRVDSYLTIVRRCGFYGDANFYVAQITAALSGCLILILQEKQKKHGRLLGILTLVLVYCGFLSGSKSFVLVSALMLIVWVVQLLKMRGQSALKKISLLMCVALAAVYIATSSLFGELIGVIVTRFSYADDLSSFTTGRTELWASYLDTLLNDAKVLLLGKGFTNVKVNARGSHNTIIQWIYQFGLIGAPVLLGWCFGFFREHASMRSDSRIGAVNILILTIGVFLPWVAIDILFFDEFFLWQWYFVLGIQAEDNGIKTHEREKRAGAEAVFDKPDLSDGN